MKMKMVKTLLFLSAVALCSSMQAQSNVPQDWFHHNAAEGSHHGVATEKAYSDILKGRTSRTVVVAVIDSGVDAEHEDLANVMWVNPGEIANNGIDDDGNGYIDDIHGWNFIGGKDGSNVGKDTYEATRIYGQLKNKYANRDASKLNKKELIEFALYEKVKEEVERKSGSAQTQLDNFNQQKTMVFGAIDALDAALGDTPVTPESIEALESGDNQMLSVGKMIMQRMFQEGGEVESMPAFREEIEMEFAGAVEHFTNQTMYAYNPDFNPRTIVKDNPNDLTEKNYGNNDVEGPDAFHGTHVSGIIAAARNNDIGMNGIADNVQIMSIRTVPDGDERDKDVANAIRYAVDNGASIINMSFGKGYSPNKKLVDKAVKYAAKKDVLLVHASGNAGMNIDKNDNFPSDTYLKKGLFTKLPQNYVSVGALSPKTGEDMVAGFSNYGKKDVDIFAPGVAIYSTNPDDVYTSSQGTSFAAPVVAGVAALLRSYFPSLTAAQVKQILLNSSNKISISVVKPGSDERVNFSELSVSGGTVDAYNAVKMATGIQGKKKVKAVKPRA